MSPHLGLVPTLRVGMHPRTLRVLLTAMVLRAAQPARFATRSVAGGIPTRSVGTRGERSAGTSGDTRAFWLPRSSVGASAGAPRPVAVL